ncbi:MAG: N-acetyltransferase [Bdellovibrionales bacterium]|nr:N-acetyltransferase [Bdellovibrionales bacterium]
MKSPVVRPARDSDSTRIFEIRNDVIRTSDAILEDEPWPRAKWDTWWGARERALPILVVADENDVAQGYALLTYFADRSGYRVTGEVSIHLDAAVRGQGHGTALFAALIEAGRAFGFLSLVARISAVNAASVRLHEKMGFQRAGHLHKVARKFGNLVDVYFYQRNFTD